MAFESGLNEGAGPALRAQVCFWDRPTLMDQVRAAEPGQANSIHENDSLSLFSLAPDKDAWPWPMGLGLSSVAWSGLRVWCQCKISWFLGVSSKKEKESAKASKAFICQWPLAFCVLSCPALLCTATFKGVIFAPFPTKTSPGAAKKRNYCCLFFTASRAAIALNFSHPVRLRHVEQGLEQSWNSWQACVIIGTSYFWIGAILVDADDDPELASGSREE